MLCIATGVFGMFKTGFSMIPLAGVVASILVSLPAAAAQGVEIRVDAGERLGKASPAVFGNSVIFGGETMGFDRWVRDQRDYDAARAKWEYYLPYLSELGPTVLRYPGGLTSNNFDWKQGIGPITERDPDYGGENIPQTFGTDEFLQYCEELGAEAILVVNVSVYGKRPGTVQGAADWVEYCNSPDDGSNPGGGVNWAAERARNGHREPYGVKYWELGNEETFPGFESYAERVRAYAAAMKAIDPTIQVGVISSGTGLDAVYGQQAWLDYRSFMVNTVGDSFDFFTQHLHMPNTSGNVRGFSMVREGATVEVDFSVDQAGEYWFEVPGEGSCWRGQCPVLSLEVDGQQVATWSVPVYDLLRSERFGLEPGEHHLRLEAIRLAEGAKATLRQQMQLFRVGQAEPLWVDLKNSSAWYHALMGGWAVAEKVYRTGEPYTGGKPVFYTEANTAYEEIKSPPFFSKSCYLREMLHTGCLYHFFLRSGVPLVNYWLLFHDRAGIGVLEGVASDVEAGELGRLDPHRRPVFHLLKAYRWNLFASLIASEVFESAGFPVGPQTGVTIGYAHQNFQIDDLQSLATITEAGDRLSVFVINLNPEQDIDAPVRLEGFPRKPQVRVLTITGPTPGASNEPEQCPEGDCVNTEARRLSLAENPLPFRFPKHSVTVLVFCRSGTDEQAPGAPVGLRGSAGDGRAFFYWEANGEPDLEGYNLYRSRCPSGPYRDRVNQVPIRVPEYLDETLDNAVTYTYALTAVDRSGNESARSEKVSVTPLEGEGDPDDLPNDDGDQSPPSPPILLEAR